MPDKRERAKRDRERERTAGVATKYFECDVQLDIVMLKYVFMRLCPCCSHRPENARTHELKNRVPVAPRAVRT